MAKDKIYYICTDCGYDVPKWQGQCPGCASWNTFTETKSSTNINSIRNQKAQPNIHKSRDGYAGKTDSKLVRLSDVSSVDFPRISTGIGELDKVLGGGLVCGSAILIGGNPGAGKSTLLLQAIDNLAATNEVIYVTGEESIQQIAQRGRRLSLKNMSSINILTETNIESAIDAASISKAKIMVIDSIQTMYSEDNSSSAGSVSQVKDSGTIITRFAKENDIALFIIGHVTKDGSLAGPKVLEHVIDASLLVENTVSDKYRTLRVQKNRFGNTNEVGVFAMTEKGMLEIKNPSGIFLEKSDLKISGSAVTSIMDGNKVILFEIQSLFTEKQSQYETRNYVGVDKNRVAMIIGVMFKFCKVSAKESDLFVNVVSGMKISETATDVAIAVSLYSSLKNIVIPNDLIVFGEIGLGSEIRPVTNCNERLNQAYNHGFVNSIIPASNKKGLNTKSNVTYAKTLNDVFSYIDKLVK